MNANDANNANIIIIRSIRIPLKMFKNHQSIRHRHY